MKRIHGLVLVATLAVGGLFLGIYARGDLESVLQASPAATAGSISGVNRGEFVADVAVRSALQQCEEDDDCGAGHICYGAQCYETCGNAADCTDDGFDCTEPRCGPVDPPDNQTHVCTARTDACTATHTVYTTLQPTDARAIGLLGTCPEETGIPPEECVFSVEAVQYRRSVDGSIKFNVVCVDTEDTATGPNAEEEDIPPCSPVEREPLAFGVGPAFGVQVGGGGGIAAAVHAGAFAGVNVGIGFSAPIVIQRKLRYPLVRNYTGTAGGNILIESGVGSILAGETVVLAHGLTSFSGGVDFFITKPVGMTLSFGWERFRDDPVCADGSGNSIADCPQKLEDALQTACRFCGSGPGGSAVAQGAAVQSDFDIQELVDALDNETQAIDDIIEELKGRIEEKIPEAFETLQDFLGSGGGSAATAEQSVMVDKMMSLLRERITADLDEIRQIARDLVACPDN